MHETELWITKLFNDYLADVGNTLRHAVGIAPEPRPWADFIAMQILVALIIMIVFAILKPRLSVDRPGKLQHTFELIYDFINGQAEEQVGHSGHNYIAFFGTIFIFILFCNLIGVIPGFESPTMIPSVPAGCAVAAFFYYNLVGIQANGVGKYLMQFVGPMPALAILMVPIELVSHLARPLSLTIRLFANMYAGEQVTLVFLKLTLLFIPVAFMGLHVFVSFLQAYIFMLLTMMYVAGAVSHEH
ncbi:MAG TPA: F0F1 ATP synthase subunit A [Verrucomicrobiae bacterium]|nr:F0F1 ATP synthase subunit A [Verrucomicrobiae bacterium]